MEESSSETHSSLSEQENEKIAVADDPAEDIEPIQQQDLQIAGRPKGLSEVTMVRDHDNWNLNN